MAKFNLLIGAATSGCGKTTFTMGLLRVLRDRGLRVQPFKCGPDYIDPLFHHQASGVESVNLDTFMSSPEHVRELFHHYGDDADVCVIEGAMGLFDGYDGSRGSAAEVAMLLDVPVLLLVNARAVAYSVAPLIHGFRHFNPALRLAGVVFNFVASDRQLATLRRACEDVGVPCMGSLPRCEALAIPSRHLGLTIEERDRMEQLIQRADEVVKKGASSLLASACEASNNIQRATISEPTSSDSVSSHSHGVVSKTFAIARDAAFNFTYRANLDALRARGTIHFFSPLHDHELPACDLLYLPGGYPELFAQELAANQPMRQAIRDYAEAGGHIVAECGGFMYLCHDIDGVPMCDVLPMSATMQGARLHLGYRKMQWNGSLFKGHEFHYSTIREESLPSTVERICLQQRATGEDVETPLYKYKNVLAGYTHWYWADRTTLS